MFRRRRGPRARSIYSFLVTWLVLSAFFPMYRLSGLLLTGGLGLLVAYLVGRAAGRREKQEEKTEKAAPAEKRKTVDTTVRKVGEKPGEKAAAEPVKKKSYGPDIDPIVEEGNRALSEMGRLYMSIRDPAVRVKINEIMRITDKIVQDAIADPSDIPKIRKFMNYYLPTTIKLLNAYDRMDAQGIEGENIGKTMNSINEMLDAAIVAYKKQLDSLFANQALDIETDIAVMNAMLDREGLSDKKDFRTQQEPKGTVAASGSH
ncbi:MAG: 5-bromo-4-chloroindolyl phosphate hydrolysis family protein [Oscillospiraceae bacterium]|nr:5-bromo-4-chloroindolyl phosphate hydrolysis family protein [Oscillospiraceae bacterium]